MDKSKVIAALSTWIRQRPGLEFGNYGDRKAYASELRSITKNYREARTLLQAVEWRDSITGDAIAEAAKNAFSGRLSIEETNRAGFPRIEVSYCAGQYWPTEYRRAVCAVLASVLWDYWRRDMPTGDEWARLESHGVTPGSYLRDRAKQEFGRGIASRWFR